MYASSSQDCAAKRTPRIQSLEEGISQNPYYRWSKEFPIEEPRDPDEPVFNVTFPSEKSCNDYRTPTCLHMGVLLARHPPSPASPASLAGGPKSASASACIENVWRRVAFRATTRA
jgi:hypothetical protein